MSQIIVVGSINMDLFIKTSIFPNSGETVLGDAFHSDLGGKGTNQAIAAANLGGEVFIIGSVGNDMYGNLSCQNLKQHNVNTSAIIMQHNVESGVAIIILNNHDNRIIVNSGANALLSTVDIQNNAYLFSEGNIILAQLEVPIDTVLSAFTLAKENKCITVLNPSPIQNLSTDLLAKTDWLILNEHEAASILNQPIDTIDDARRCLPLLQSMGVPNIVLTLGADGCVYSLDNDIIHHPARNVTAIDTTGAGDSFCGALVYSLSKNISVRNAIELATIVSSFTVTKDGTSSSFPTVTEVESILKKEGISIELS